MTKCQFLDQTIISYTECWGESIIYEEYVKEITKQTGVTPKLLEKELQIDEKELERFG